MSYFQAYSDALEPGEHSEETVRLLPADPGLDDEIVQHHNHSPDILPSSVGWTASKRRLGHYDSLDQPRRIRCDSAFCFLVTFFAGICFGMAMFPMLVTYISLNQNSEIRHLPPNRDPRLSRSSGGPLEGNSTGTSQANPVTFTPVRFEDVAGMDEAKYELSEIVQFLRTPGNFTKIGARMPKGVLLVGPPGSGKTMLARAVATEAHVPYLYTSGSEFIEIYIGQGAKRIRDLFAYARSRAPCIVFVDELDAVGGKRQSGINTGGQREHDQTLNQLLVELDGFNATSGIVVLGATNRVDVLDDALLRPGRFDRIVHVPLPDLSGRELILRRYLRRVRFNETDVDVKSIARVTPGFSGAELENLVNEAAILSARQQKTMVGKEELLEARDKVSMGPALRSVVMSESQKRLTAYHEAGHALVAHYLVPHADPIHKATIVTRGSALGFVEQMPPDNRYGHARAQLEARLAVAMGGRLAEELVFGHGAVSNGASSDIAMATSLAYRMVSEWGMSDKLGPLNYNRGIGSSPMMGSISSLSNESASLVEKEVRRLVNEAKRTAERILRKHRKKLDTIAMALLEKETLTGKEIEELIDPGKAKCTKDSIIASS